VLSSSGKDLRSGVSIFIVLALAPLASCKSSSRQEPTKQRAERTQKKQASKPGVEILFEQIKDGELLAGSFTCEVPEAEAPAGLTHVRVKTPARETVTLKREDRITFGLTGELARMAARFPGGEYVILLDSGAGADARTEELRRKLSSEVAPYPEILEQTHLQKGVSTTPLIRLGGGPSSKSFHVQVEQEDMANDEIQNSSARVVTVGPGLDSYQLTEAQRLKPMTRYHLEVEAHGQQGNRVSRVALHFTTGPK